MQNTPLKYVPTERSLVPIAADAKYMAPEVREKAPSCVWYRDPWTGDFRSDHDINTDPLGIFISPEGTPAPTGVDATLAERGSRYGVYGEHARITQNIKRAMADSPNWPVLSDDKKETLEMLAHKIGRILNGDPEYHDSWHDIIGYTKLVADTLQP